MKQQLTTIADWLEVKGQNMADVLVEGVSIDSRSVQTGDLFIPFRGEQVNGHKFVIGAIKKGAVASLWLESEPNPPKDIPLIFVEDSEIALQEMAYIYRRTLDCKVIGITGSNGKTSTKDLVASVLAPYFNVRKTEGNFNNELGMPLTILSLDEDTEFAVLEMGMSGYGEISFLSKLAKPDYVIITNIGEAHMQDLGSREGIAKAKFEIIDGLALEGKLFYDGDEPLLQSLVEENVSISKLSFGHGKQNDLILQEMKTADVGSDFTVSGIFNDKFTIPVYGAHQVKNTLAAILIAKEADLSKEEIRDALSGAVLTDMRMQPILVNNGALFINDAYNAAPTSMQAALSFLKETSLRTEKWVVLGDMLELGKEEQGYHEKIADQLVDMKLEGILLFGPRMKWLYDELKRKEIESRLVWTTDDYNPIVQELQKSITKNSLVLLKGSRGMALENVLELFNGGDRA